MQKKFWKRALRVLPVLGLAGLLGVWGAASTGSRAANAWEGADIEEILGSMTIRDKACQMMCMYQVQIPDATNPGKFLSYTETGDPLKKSLEVWPVGGILYDKASMNSRSQLKDLVTKANSYSRVPMLFTVDEEGGRVTRVWDKLKYQWMGEPKAMLTYESGGPSVARSNAAGIGKEIAYYGFNLDFAPVADVHSNPSNPVINDRAYSTSFDTASELIPAAVEGFHDAGVGCTLKHFPGHGDTSGDTHAGSVYTYKSLDEIRRNELQPFQAGIDAGADAVMIAHVIVKELGEPCVFSREIVTDILRDEMGFDGLVITDGLTMQAMTDVYSPSDIVRKGIAAGVDMFLCPASLEEAVDAIVSDVENGKITETRLDASVRRILQCKRNVGAL